MTELEKKTENEEELNTDEKTENEAAGNKITGAENKSEETNAFDITEKFKRQQQSQPQVKPRELVGVTDKKVETKRLLIFIGLCFGVTWLTEIFSIIPMYRSGNAEAIQEAAGMVSQLMLAPALSAMAARIATREGLAKSGLQFNFSEHKLLFLFGWFGTTALTFLGAVIYFLVFRDNFDPQMGNFMTVYSASMADKNVQTDNIDIMAVYRTDLLIKIFSAAVLDIINSFGEEWGFRAYLLPKLYRKFGTVPSMVLCGFASGLWYAPLVAAGYYYGSANAGFPVVNILAMCVFGTVTGIIYSFLCLRTGSVFPSVFAHSAVNVMMSQATLLTYDGGNYFVGPAPTGILSGLPFIIVAVLCLVYMKRHPLKVNEE
ncbi:MAG: CPBP family intramembrane metalloprotease [Lachnospiraceae bacterium]|nr:CPBP family intramembrane metalloprotease [Lachnospiraceae bacterium]